MSKRCPKRSPGLPMQAPICCSPVRLTLLCLLGYTDSPALPLAAQRTCFLHDLGSSLEQHVYVATHPHSFCSVPALFTEVTLGYIDSPALPLAAQSSALTWRLADTSTFCSCLLASARFCWSIALLYRRKCTLSLGGAGGREGQGGVFSRGDMQSVACLRCKVGAVEGGSARCPCRGAGRQEGQERLRIHAQRPLRAAPSVQEHVPR